MANSIIGSIGDIVFELTPKAWKTFDELKRSTSGRWEKNNIHLQAPRAHYVGSELDTVSLRIRLKTEFGVNPRAEIARLQDYSRSGKVMPFIIGGKAEGRNKWYIANVDGDYENIDNKGVVHSIDVTLQLGEYV